MLFELQATAMLAPGYLRFGRLHLPVYGVFAVLGLLAALWLSQRTARAVGLAPEKLWDAGVFAIVAAFVASRLLLIAFNLTSFLRYPLLLLALPSLTYEGMALTALAVWGYLRWKRLPWRDVADAWAPCGALLAAMLSLGHFVEGTHAGMPTQLPWGVITAGDTVLGRVHPVQMYEVLLALLASGGLLWGLRRRGFAGQVAAVAMVVGGAVAFLLDMLRQPMESSGTSLLDAGQMVALLMMVGGAVLWVTPAREKVELN